MAFRYRFIIEGFIEISTERSPTQIRNAFVVADPSVRNAIKKIYRDKVALDGSGETVILNWQLHTDNVTPLDGGPDVDLDEGTTEETEPVA